jgi:hypothetical protein
VETPTRKRVQASVTGAVASAPETFGEPLIAGEDDAEELAGIELLGRHHRISLKTVVSVSCASSMIRTGRMRLWEM